MSTDDVLDGVESNLKHLYFDLLERTKNWQKPVSDLTERIEALEQEVRGIGKALSPLIGRRRFMGLIFRSGPETGGRKMLFDAAFGDDPARLAENANMVISGYLDALSGPEDPSKAESPRPETFEMVVVPFFPGDAMRFRSDVVGFRRSQDPD